MNNKIISFNTSFNPTIKISFYEKDLIKDNEWYHYIFWSLIHYFDKNKNYQTSKIYINN